MNRTAVTPGRLYALLSTAFEHARAESCRMCKMPMPYPVAAVGGESANWRVGTSIHSCAECQHVMEKIIETMSSAYDLRDLTRDFDRELERRSHPRMAAKPASPRPRPGS